MTEYTQPYFRIWSTSRDSGEKISSTTFKIVWICTLLLARLSSHFVLFMFRNLTSHLNFHFLRWVTFSQTICILFALVFTWNNSLTNLISEKAMAPHCSTLAWKIPWTEEPGGLQSMGSLRVGHNWATSLSLFTLMLWRRKWRPIPVFLPGESQGRGNLVVCHLWGRTESDTTEAT